MRARVLPGDHPWDYAVVGAGILGLAVAHELQRRRPSARVVVLEQENDIAMHQTGHNSGVIHAGLYYKPGSLKATLCRQGADAMYAYCDRRGVAVRRSGKLVIARSRTELGALDALERRARANGVPGLRRVAGHAIERFEPSARGEAALHSSGTGVVNFVEVAAALADDVRAGGGEIVTGCRITRTSVSGQTLLLSHLQAEIRARFAVFCAGAWSDRLAWQADAPIDHRIVPFRGAYLRLKPERQHLVEALIYPVPDPRLPFLGVHLTRHIDGVVTIGPTALPVLSRTAYRLPAICQQDAADTITWPGTWRMARRWWRRGVSEIGNAASRDRLLAQARAFVPTLDTADVERDSQAGIRAQAVGRDGALIDDFVLAASRNALHVCNAPSPAATASLALACHVVDVVERHSDHPWSRNRRS